MARTIEGIARRKEQAKARQQTPEYKAYHKAYRQLPANKIKALNDQLKYRPLKGPRKKTIGRINANNAKRRAIKLNATPKWLSKEQLKEVNKIYKRAIELTKTTGIKHEVDHIIPLLGKNVRGLHVPWNLQVLTKQQNRSKGNRS